MQKIEEGCMAFLVDNPYPFMVTAHVNDKTFEGLWDCTLVSEMHQYQRVFLKGHQLARITQDDELVIELYARGID